MPNLYPATLSLRSDGELMVTGNGQTETMQDALAANGHTLLLCVRGEASDSEPSWEVVLEKLKGIANVTFTVAPSSPLTLSANGGVTGIAQPSTLTSALATSGQTLLVALRAASAPSPTPPPGPAWTKVADLLASLGSVTFGTEMTCVGRPTPAPTPAPGP